MHEMKVDGKLEYREPMTPTEFACEFIPHIPFIFLFAQSRWE